MYNWQEKSLIDEVKDLIARVENSVNNEWVTLKDKEGEPYHVNIDEEEEKPAKPEEKKETKENKKTPKNYYEQEYKKALKEIAEGKDYAQINFNTTISEMKSALAHLKRYTDWDKYDVYDNITEYEDLSDNWNKEQIGRIAREKAAQETLKKWIAEGKDRKNEYYKIYEPQKYKKTEEQPKQMKLFNSKVKQAFCEAVSELLAEKVGEL